MGPLDLRLRCNDAMAGVLIDLVEADLFRIGSRGIQSDGTGHQGQTKETLPIGAGGHTQYSGYATELNCDSSPAAVPSSCFAGSLSVLFGSVGLFNL